MARRIEFFDGFTSTTTPTIGNISASDLVKYPDDATYEATELGAPIQGNIYWNTTVLRVRYYDGTDWQSVGREVDVIANASDIADIRTTTGTADGDTDMGTYTGSLIPDAESTKQNIQAVEVAVESNTQEVVDIRTTTGTANGATDMGTYTGGIITDNISQAAINQEIEDAIESIPAGLAFQGNWNADTNTPALVSSTGTAGHYYNVSVAGTTSLDGEADWGVGDWAIFTDTGVWQKVDNSENVTSVNGQTGVVSLDTDDVAEGSTNLYYTDVRADARITAASIDDLSDVDTSTVAPTDTQVLAWNNTDSEWQPSDAASVVLPTMQVFTSGSGTYTTPAGVTRIEIIALGGGGGGEGSGVADGGAGGNGGNTTFGGTIVVANGGVGAVAAVNGGLGGTASIAGGAIGFAVPGGMGGARADNPASTNLRSGEGGVSAHGGAGGSAVSLAAGGSAVANSGSGGAGGGRNGSGQVGGGGGSGGYVSATVGAPIASYAYVVGTGGTFGTAGTTGFAAGQGASGTIIVKEFY